MRLLKRCRPLLVARSRSAARCEDEHELGRRYRAREMILPLLLPVELRRPAMACATESTGSVHRAQRVEGDGGRVRSAGRGSKEERTVGDGVDGDVERALGVIENEQEVVLGPVGEDGRERRERVAVLCPERVERRHAK